MAMDEVHVCRICRRPLDLHESPGGDRRWLHAAIDLPETHAPEPVPLAATGGEQVGACDFCTKAGPSWSYPCEDFAMDAGPGLPVYNSVGAWAACGDCHRAIVRKDWATLERRAVAAHRGPFREVAPVFVRRLHRAFRRHRSGAPTRL